MTKSEQIKEQRRTQIIQAVCRCLQNKPSAALTVGDVAKEAGIAYGLIHYYFISKEKLIFDTIDYINDLFAGLILEEMAPYQGRELSEETVLEFFRKYHRRLYSDEYLLYLNIWYDLLSQKRFCSEGKEHKRVSAYDSRVAEPLGRLVCPNENYRKIYDILMTFMEGMSLRICLYGRDPELETANGEALLRCLFRNAFVTGERTIK